MEDMGINIGEDVFYGTEVPIVIPNEKSKLEKVLKELEDFEGKISLGEYNGTEYRFTFSKVIDKEIEEKFLFLTMHREDIGLMNIFTTNFGKPLAEYVHENGEWVYEWDWTKHSEGRYNVLEERGVSRLRRF